jgi:predicted transposase YbfD/YdcC
MAKGFAPPSTSSSAPAMKRVSNKLLDEIRHIDDPRTKREPQHLLLDVLTIAILATLAGADTMTAVETYGKAKQAWLSTFLALPHGIPSHDTFSRVFNLLEPQQFNRFFQSLMAHLTKQLNIKLIHIDGKTLRGSYDRENQIKALHSVSAWASEHQLVLGQQRVDGKSNEITAIPHLLELLSLEGTIITLDAMGTQRAIAEQIIKGKGDYILALKGNHGNLCKGVKQFFKEALANDWKGIEHSYYERTEPNHHRIEYRQVWVVPLSAVPELANAHLWTGLNAIVMVRRKRTLWNKVEEEVSYYITSLSVDATEIAGYIRAHWSVENNCHWVLDMTFKEDRSRIRIGHGPENTGLLRRLCLGVLKRDSSKGSLVQKRYRAAMDDTFMMSLLANLLAA